MLNLFAFLGVKIIYKIHKKLAHNSSKNSVQLKHIKTRVLCMCFKIFAIMIQLFIKYKTISKILRKKSPPNPPPFRPTPLDQLCHEEKSFVGKKAVKSFEKYLSDH